jgi:hypothetical protein
MAATIFSTSSLALLASSGLLIASQRSAYSLPYLTNIPAINTDSATGPSLGPKVWKDSPGSLEKQFKFRQSFQSARPINGRLCGPLWLTV